MTSKLWRTAIQTVSKLMILAFLLASYCVAKDKVPVMYPFSELRRVVVPPVIDNTGNTKKIYDPEKIHKRTIETLEALRYEPILQTDSKALQGLTQEDLKTANADLINRIVPEGERWALVVCFGDISIKLGVANAQIFGFLFDKERGKLAWSNIGADSYDNVTTNVGGGGALAEASVFKGIAKNTAVNNAVYKLFKAFPKLPKEENLPAEDEGGKIYNHLVIKSFEMPPGQELPPDSARQLGSGFFTWLGKTNRFREITVLNGTGQQPANADIELSGKITEFKPGKGNSGATKIRAVVEFKEVASGKVICTGVVNESVGTVDSMTGLVDSSPEAMAKNVAKIVEKNLP
jgi:hypothetical protein